MSAAVPLERDAAGATMVRLNRPERLNALGVATTEALRRAFAERRPPRFARRQGGR